MTRILVWGVVAVTALYLLVNLGYLAVLGHGGIRESKAVAADVMRVLAGDKAVVLLALIVCISVLTTINAAIFTGARTSWALGRDFRILRFLGNWREQGSTPANALLLQGAITLLLVAAGAATPDGFNAMVAYTTPVFWTFMYLVATSLFVIRDRAKDKEPGLGLGVVVLDCDGDGKPDLYVANDGVGNFLYRNRSTPGRLRLEEMGAASGVAFNDRGAADGSMGADAADYEGSGRPSLWVTNYEDQLHALYRNLGKGLFLFSTTTAGISAIGQSYVSFGTGFLDLDHHGWEDLVVVNGHVLRYPQHTRLRQRPVLLRNLGNGRFADITTRGGEYFRTDHIARGLAIGDLDNHGRPGLVISHQNEPVVILRNEAGTGRHWLGFELAGRDHRDVVGARVVVELAGHRLTRFAKGGASYLSSSDRRLVFGLGTSERVERVTVFWPWGSEQSWAGDGLTIDRYWRLSEGMGLAAAKCGPRL